MDNNTEHYLASSNDSSKDKCFQHHLDISSKVNKKAEYILLGSQH